MPSSRIDSAMKVAAISRLRSFRSYSDCKNNVNIILCNLVCKVMDHLNGLVHNRKIYQFNTIVNISNRCNIYINQ